MYTAHFDNNIAIGDPHLWITEGNKVVPYLQGSSIDDSNYVVYCKKVIADGVPDDAVPFTIPDVVLDHPGTQWHMVYQRLMEGDLPVEAMYGIGFFLKDLGYEFDPSIEPKLALAKYLMKWLKRAFFAPTIVSVHSWDNHFADLYSEGDAMYVSKMGSEDVPFSLRGAVATAFKLIN
ncbi:MAG: hypothetical protein ACOCXQ_03845 [Patescibacteria group bacterium]